ncbi:MAG: choice-of-anchor X domain-containing protein [Bellilinea sp.]|jgi:hypothetical protein
MKSVLVVFLLALFTASAFSPLSAGTASSAAIYSDGLAAGWQDWSWANVNLNQTAPVFAGSKSIAVNFNAWEGLSFYKADADTTGMTLLQFYLHGGSAGGQRMNVYLNFENGSQGPLVSVPAPIANAWQKVELPLAALNPNGLPINRVTWQDASGGSQAVVYLDEISFTVDVPADAPQIVTGYFHPRSIPADGFTAFIVQVQVDDPQGTGDIVSVSLDATSISAGTIALKDDGLSNDHAAGDGIYGAAVTVANGLTPREVDLRISAVDAASNTAHRFLGKLVVLGQPGGVIPSGLPDHTGWGSNAWNENPAQDWQINSGVPWDYVYQYITWGWEGWGDHFVRRFVQHAWNNDFVPVVTVYLMLGVPPNNGEGGRVYAEKLTNSSTVNDYFSSLQRAATEARGELPVIFNIEPDFYGFMQQVSNESNPPAGVRPDDPSSYYVALHKPGYANNLAGFGQYLVDMIHAAAPNALVAPMASMWAVNGDPQLVSAADAVSFARRTALFIHAMGGDRADMLVVEWSDRDAGRGIRPWWDDNDRNLPRPNRAILWKNVLSRESGKRLLLWQVPVGNMNLDDTCSRYRDNRAAYLFDHPRDLADAGVIGILFGGGDTCSTQVESDGGHVQQRGQIAYAAPNAPQGLRLISAQGAMVRLNWRENQEADLWGYRLYYHREGDSRPFVQTLSRQNTKSLILPIAGEWIIWLTAYDALGTESLASPVLRVTTTENAGLNFLPFVRR